MGGPAEPVVRARGLGKAYRIYDRPLDSLKELFLRRPLHQTFWALRGLDLDLAPGETLGVIGDNGAGKSTLLKLLAGTLEPTAGRLQVRGRVSAILELGAGFHPEFSGLDNARIGCAILGLSAEETEARLPEILDFSELGEFIHRPVKTYSSGMYVRLAFSVVTSVDPDVLVVDEALSVGDGHFAKKSMDRMMSFRSQGRTLVFCSHNLYHVKELCHRALWLHQGTPRMLGEAREVVDAYHEDTLAQDRAPPPAEVAMAPRKGPVPSLLDVRLERGQGRSEDGRPRYRTHGPFRVRVVADRAGYPLEDVHVGIVFIRNDGLQCYGVSTAVDGVRPYALDGDRIAVCLDLDDLPLLSGEYALEVWLIDATSVHVYDGRKPCCPFRVRQETTEVGMIWMAHTWNPPDEIAVP